jgi:hypothetical protein
MIENIGTIEIKNFYNELGMIERQTFKWKGPPTCKASYELLDEMLGPVWWALASRGEPIDFGPYKLRMVEDSPWENIATFVRQDWPFWWLLIAWHRVNRLAEIAYRRFIITLAVWGFAERRWEKMPVLDNIHLVKRFKNWRRRNES